MLQTRVLATFFKNTTFGVDKVLTTQYSLYPLQDMPLNLRWGPACKSTENRSDLPRAARRSRRAIGADFFASKQAAAEDSSPKFSVTAGRQRS